jgi:hypothetical protein
VLRAIGSASSTPRSIEVGTGVVVVATSVAVGAAAVRSPALALLAVVAALSAAGLAAPAGVWAGATLVSALTARGLVELNVLPGAATYLDIPLAWGALFVALAHSRADDERGRRLTAGLTAFGCAVLFSWLANPSELIRPIVYFAILAQPFALVAALLIEPPSPRVWRLLIRLSVALLLIQLPVVALQFALYGTRDSIQGTLYGAGAGAHTISAVVLVGSLWLAAVSGRAALSRRSRLALAAPLFGVPFLADAKQVILASPLILAGSRLSLNWRAWIVRAAVVAGAVAAVLALHPAGPTALRFIEETKDQQGGKVAAAKVVFREMTEDLPSTFLGKGPAETISRTAFLTVETASREGSPLAVLELHPAAVAREAQYRASISSGGGTSFNSGVSSALGVFGDLGLLGGGVLVYLMVFVFRALRRTGTPEAAAAAGGWAMLWLLGLVFDWWEQPPFTVFLAVISALALTGRAHARLE